MENTFVIAWKSRTEPRWGRGKKLLTREEAEALAAELNEDHPAFFHEAVNVAAEVINVNFNVTPVAEAEPQPIAV